MRGLFIHSEWVVRFIGSHGLDNSLQVGGDCQQCEVPYCLEQYVFHTRYYQLVQCDGELAQIFSIKFRINYSNY